MQETYEKCRAHRPVPVISFHGTSDYIVPYDGSDGELISVDNVIRFWKDKNQILDQGSTVSYTDKSTSVVLYSFEDTVNNMAIKHYKIQGGSHIWFDLNLNGMDTGDIIWNFFKQYELR